MMRDVAAAGVACCSEGCETAFDVVVVGAGPAGMAAGVAAKQAGAGSVLVVEREAFAGGVLPQCVHDGFGLHVHGASLTGPEYAQRWSALAQKSGVRFAFRTTVLEVSSADGCFAVDAVGAALGGHVRLRAASVVVATGCRERTRGQMMLPGSRPAGVMTAGTAQYMMNVLNQMPGDEAVILGSGDIGLIMARRLTLEGACVRMVLGQAATGLLRNHVRCVQDFSLPFRYGWGVKEIRGRGRLEGVVIAPFAEDGAFAEGRDEFVSCNLLLISCGLIPEREIVQGLGQELPTGLFICGNASVPHDLVDQVTQEGLRAGRSAAACALSGRGREAKALPRQIDVLLRRRVIEPKGRVQELLGSAGLGGQLIPCTECPSSCMIRRSADGAFDGYGCKRGLAFAEQEVREPMRMFTGAARVEGGARRLVPVRTTAPVSRALVLEVAKQVRELRVAAPVELGAVLRRNVAGSGADVVATCSIAALPEGARAGETFEHADEIGGCVG